MNHKQRLERLEAQLLNSRGPVPVPAGCAVLVAASGQAIEPRRVQMFDCWPLTVPVRQWERGPTESAEQFERRVFDQAGPGALLVAQ